MKVNIGFCSPHHSAAAGTDEGNYENELNEAPRGGKKKNGVRETPELMANFNFEMVRGRGERTEVRLTDFATQKGLGIMSEVQKKAERRVT